VKLISLACLVGLFVASIARADFESLGRPCRAFNVLATRVVKDPAGKEWYVLSNTNEATGVELIFIDFHNNTAKKYPAPAGQGAWLLNQVPGDRLIVGTYYDGKLMVFDLKSMRFTKVIAFPGEQYFWNGTLGGDGRLYGGTYPGAKLGALDLNTLALEDCGAPAPPNLYCRTVSALPDGRLLCAFTTEKQVAKIYDPKTKSWSDLPAAMKHVTRIVSWNGYALAVNGWDSGKVSGVVAFKGADLSPVDPPPFPVPPKDQGECSVDVNMTTPTTLYLRQKSAIWKYSVGDKALTKIFDQDLKAGAILAVASDGTLLGMRGQDYVIAQPGQTTAKLLSIPVQAGPRPPHFIRADDQNRLWGGPQFGQTLFYLDLATKKFTNTGLVCNAGGEVYDCEFYKGKTYAVAYVGGDIVVYDPAQPWDEMGGKNPRTIAHLTTKGYIRPVAGIHLASDGTLYSGWIASYGKYGGAIAVTNPDSEETTLIENPLGQQGISSLAVDDQFLYVGTTLEGNGLPPKPNEKPQFGILDRAGGKVVFQQPLGEGGIGRIVIDRKTNQLAIVADHSLKLFDLASRKFKELPPDIAGLSMHAHTLAAYGDGRIIFASEKTLLTLDLATGAISKATAPGKIENVCLGPDQTVYLSSGPDVYQLKPEPRP